MIRQSEQATVFHIARSSLHDGSGLRTVVYLKGCPLRCRWCHNPEGLAPHPDILYRPMRCIGCGRCLRQCPDRHILQDGAHLYLRDGCTACGACARACPTEALALCGEQRTAQDVFCEVEKDAMYYRQTGGGVTVSGGECLLYPAFVAELLQRCKAAGIGTCIETCFHLPWTNIAAVLPWLDTLIVDLKHADDTVHRRLTGAGNRLILQNIEKASHLHRDIWVRIPLIPGANDSDENLRASAVLLSGFGPGIRQVELLKYNPMAQSKYAALDTPAEVFGQPQTDEQLAQKQAVLRGALDGRIAVRQ